MTEKKNFQPIFTSKIWDYLLNKFWKNNFYEFYRKKDEKWMYFVKNKWNYINQKIADVWYEKKFYDYQLWIPWWKYYCFELKQEKRSLSFNFDKLQTHQDYYLDLQLILWNQSFVCIDWYNTKLPWRNKHLYFCIPYWEYKNIKETNGTSVKFEKLLWYSYTDLTEFFTKII